MEKKSCNMVVQIHTIRTLYGQVLIGYVHQNLSNKAISIAQKTLSKRLNLSSHIGQR